MSLLQMSLSAGLLVIAILLIRKAALNKLPKTMFLVLWGVALFRLLIPFFIPAQFGFYRFIGDISNKINSVLPVTEIMSGSLAGTDVSGAAGQMSDVSQAPIFSFDPALITTIWLIGMFAAFVFFAAVYIRSHRELRFATLIQDNDFLNDWLSKHKLIRPLAIMQSDRISTPIAVGIIKPKIILPKSMNLDDKQLLSYVLTHEYYHIKRFDALWKLILAFALCVHWFNPMVWVMFALVNRDLELTCDEMVIRRFGTEIKTDYAYGLIRMAEQKNKFTLYNGFSKNMAEERIVSVMKTKKTSRISLILACVLISLLTAGVLVVSATDTQPEPLTPPDVVGGHIFTRASPHEIATWMWDEDKGEWVKSDDYVSVTIGKNGKSDFVSFTGPHFSLDKDSSSGIVAITVHSEREDGEFKIYETDGAELKIFRPDSKKSEFNLFFSETEGLEMKMLTRDSAEQEWTELNLIFMTVGFFENEKTSMKHGFHPLFRSLFKDRPAENEDIDQ